MILAGDVGGTHTRLGLFHPTGELKAVAEKKYLNRDASGLDELIQEFLREHRVKITAVCLAVAGTIQGGRCRMTNLPWTIDAEVLRGRLGVATCLLINDLEAHALGLSLLEEKDLCVLQTGMKRVGNQALVFAGTGLGEAGLIWDGERHHPFAGEGGHADFAPRNEVEMELFFYLREKYNHVSYERVLSGQGLKEISHFLGKEAVELFLSIYGAEAGNVALKFLAVGGVYIGGGMAVHLADRIKGSSFLESFCDKGRFQGLMQTIPVSLVLSDDTALLGAAQFGQKKTGRGNRPAEI